MTQNIYRKNLDTIRTGDMLKKVLNYEKENAMAYHLNVLKIGLLSLFLAVVLPAGPLAQGGKGGGKAKQGKVQKKSGDSPKAKSGKGEPGKPGDKKGKAGPSEKAGPKGAVRGKHAGDANEPGDHGNGLAMGKDKEKGEGLKLGKDKEPGEGLALGKDKGGEANAQDDEAARAIRRAKHRERLEARRTALKKNPKHKRLFDSGMKKKGPIAKEQRKHLRRMAKLRRLLAVSVQKQDIELAGKLRELHKKERNRHQMILRKLNEKTQEPKGKK